MKVIGILFIFLFSGLSFGKTINSFNQEELDSYKKDLETKMEKNLKQYLGDIAFSSFVKINSTKTTPKKVIDDSQLFLLGGGDLQVEPKIKISSIDVKVIVYESLDDAFNKEINDIIRFTAEPFKANIKTTYVESTRYYSEQLKNQGDDSLSFFQKLLRKNSSEIIQLIGVILISIVAIFGVLILARLLKAPLNTIAESIKDMSNSSNQNNVSVDSDDEVNVNDESEVSEKEMQEISLKFRDNLQILKEIIFEKPKEISTIINRSDRDAAGVKKLIPYIYEQKYIKALKDNIPNKDFKIVNNSQYNFESLTQFFKWFNEIIEDLSVTTLTKTWAVVEKLPSDLLYKLLKVPMGDLEDYATKNPEPEVYQVIMDIISNEDKEKFGNSLDVDVWKIILKADDIETVRVIEIAESIIADSSSGGGSQSEVISANKIQDNVIIPTLLNILPFKKLRIQDDFLNSLESVSLETIKSLRAVYWTPRSLFMVPKNYLAEVLRNYSVEQKVEIIVSMPEDVKKLLVETLPEGKVKLIVEDKLKDNQKSISSAGESVARSFIDSLHDDHIKGLFEAEEEPLAERLSKTSSMSKVDDDDDDFDFGDDLDDDFDDLDDDFDGGEVA